MKGRAETERVESSTEENQEVKKYDKMKAAPFRSVCFHSFFSRLCWLCRDLSPVRKLSARVT
jgi:hypothetical protein